jgi:hypothetical protein
MDTLAVLLTLPLAGCVGDLHPQVNAPCRAHQREGERLPLPLVKAVSVVLSRGRLTLASAEHFVDRG